MFENSHNFNPNPPNMVSMGCIHLREKHGLSTG